ncbi:MAG: cell division protein FtsZ [Gallionella sp.]
MKRRIFIKQLLAMGVMTHALKAVAVNIITDGLGTNAAVPVGTTVSLPEYEDRKAVIKVIGVGGAGCNALNLMIDEGVYGAQFIAIDSDAQTLKRNKAHTRFQLDLNNDLPSRQADRAYIASLLSDANAVFIVAGMGGKTGTGVAAWVAEISRELNILTVSVVSRPYISEGSRVFYAVKGIRALRDHVDSLMVVPIPRVMNKSGVAMQQAFQIANGIFRNFVASITEVINFPGLIAVDFADVCTVLTEGGATMMGSAGASGYDRAKNAAEQAVASPLLENTDLSGASAVLVNITSTTSIKLKELDQVMSCVQLAAEEATVVLAATFDKSMGDEMRVTIVATGMKYLSPGNFSGFSLA